MRFVRLAGLVASAAVAASWAGGCGHKAPRRSHAAVQAEPAPPTPDTTPVASLRTPAGWLLLKTETPPPASTPTPAAGGAAKTGG